MATPGDPPQLRVDPSLLLPIVEGLLGRGSLTLAEWHGSPIPYTNFLPGRALWLVSGTANAAGEYLPWKMVLKVIRPPDSGRTITAGQPNGLREIEAYGCGLLHDLPGNHCAPRAVHIPEEDHGEVWLWLEHVTDHYDHLWPLSTYAIAARHLGQFNGAYLTDRPIPAAPWLMTGWAAWLSEPTRALVVVPTVNQLLENLRVEAAFPIPIADRARRLLRDQPRFLAILDKLPQTLCHHDAAQANLLARRRRDGEAETVAIDWECLGPGTVGADLASLVFSTLRRGDVSRRRPSILDPHVAYLRERWTAGYQNAHTLWAELCARGFTGSPAIVRRLVASWRPGPGRSGPLPPGVPLAGQVSTPPRTPPARALSPRQARWLLLRPPADLDPDKHAYRAQLLQCDWEIQQAYALTAEFEALIRGRELDNLSPWLGRARGSTLPEFAAFAQSLERDRAAVEAALTYTWSSGQVEGQITRLKLRKRESFGRAGFVLLKRQVLHVA